MRTRLIYILMVILPVAAYWPLLVNDFGMHGDYAQLRLAKSDPGAGADSGSHSLLTRAMHDSSFTFAHEVDSFFMIRLLTIGLLILLAVFVWRQLDGSGWPEWDSAVVGLMIAFLPASQVIAGWAECWTRVAAALFAVAGFAAVETELEAGGLKRVVAVFGGLFIYALGAAVHPVSTLFAMVPLAGVLLFKVRKDQTAGATVAWASVHVATIIAGIVAGRLADEAMGGTPWTPFGGLLATAEWLVLDAAPGAMAVLALNDDHFVGWMFFWPAVVVTVLLVAKGIRVEIASRGESASRKAWICVAVLPVTFAVMMLALAASPSGYRDALSVAGLAVVAVVAALRALRNTEAIPAWLHSVALAVLLGAAAYLAHMNVDLLIAGPQAQEWQFAKGGVQFAKFEGDSRVFVTPATHRYRQTERIYADEFGAPSSVDPGTAREMIEVAVKKRTGGVLPKGVNLQVEVGSEPDKNAAYKAIVDFRKIGHWRD